MQKQIRPHQRGEIIEYLVKERRSKSLDPNDQTINLFISMLDMFDQSFDSSEEEAVR